MDDVKRWYLDSYCGNVFAQSNTSDERIQASDPHYFVLDTDFDAQRLRADTAEVEAQIQYAKRVAVVEELSAAEQRIAGLVAAIGTYLEGTGSSPGSNRRHAELRATLNPKPEAGNQ